MKQTGVVTGIDKGNVKVLINRLSSCGSHCATCKASCEIKPVEIKVKNDIGAKVGDKVEVESETKSILKAIMILYSIPFLFLLAGIGLGMLIFKGKTEMYELASFALGLVFLLASFFVIRSIDNKYKDKSRLVELTRILE